MERAERYYPIGIQTFSELIRRRCVYVDKTDLMWRLQDRYKYIFLARPRRFGKSLLSSTFHSFFGAEKELFEGLKVIRLEIRRCLMSEMRTPENWMTNGGSKLLEWRLQTYRIEAPNDPNGGAKRMDIWL